VKFAIEYGFRFALAATCVRSKAQAARVDAPARSRLARRRRRARSPRNPGSMHRCVGAPPIAAPY
jgi:hypothetical protein